MGFQLYELRILALENDYRNTKREIGVLLRMLKHSPSSLDIKAVHSLLDLLNASVRMIKEQTQYYVKLGSIYDIMRMHEELVEELRRRNPELAASIINEMDLRWSQQAVNVATPEQ